MGPTCKSSGGWGALPDRPRENNLNISYFDFVGKIDSLSKFFDARFFYYRISCTGDPLLLVLAKLASTEHPPPSVLGKFLSYVGNAGSWNKKTHMWS